MKLRYGTGRPARTAPPKNTTHPHLIGQGDRRQGRNHYFTANSLQLRLLRCGERGRRARACGCRSGLNRQREQDRAGAA